MRYLIISLLLITFIGCGSSSADKKEDNDTVKPSSPKLQDSSRQPPSIPTI